MGSDDEAAEAELDVSVRRQRQDEPLGIAVDNSLCVIDVLPDSVSNGRLRKDDVLLLVDGRPITERHQLADAVKQAPLELTFRVQRPPSPERSDCADADAPLTADELSRGRDGCSYKQVTLRPRALHRLGLRLACRPTDKRVVVEHVHRLSVAKEQVRVGDVIVSVNNHWALDAQSTLATLEYSLRCAGDDPHAPAQLVVERAGGAEPVVRLSAALRTDPCTFSMPDDLRETVAGARAMTAHASRPTPILQAPAKRSLLRRSSKAAGQRSPVRIQPRPAVVSIPSSAPPDAVLKPVSPPRKHE